MPKFKCENKNCEGYGEEELVPHVKFIWNETTKKLEAKEAACPVCQVQRETVREAGPITLPWFKAENSRNYNNKKIKKYDYDHDAAKSTTTPLSQASIRKEAERN